VAEAEAVQAETAAVAQRAERRAAAQAELLDDLAQKLAVLTGRSAALEREYLDSLEHGGSGSGGSGGSGGAPTPSAPPTTPPSSPPAGPSPSPSAPAPSPSAPAPSPSPSTPSTPPTAPPTTPPPTGSGPTPNPTVVAATLAFARAQLGEPYQWGASGPDSWDCSGLTMMAYAAGGLAIGGHSVSAQYNRAASRGLLVPYAQALPGDLIFYSYGGSASGSKYHVAIYIGNGQMLEAPSAGKPVRIVTVRSYDRIPVVARPSG
jgi:cell wall-associated NlpC family hydrolase